MILYLSISISIYIYLYLSCLSWRKGLLRCGLSLLPSTSGFAHSVPIATAWFHTQIGTGCHSVSRSGLTSTETLTTRGRLFLCSPRKMKRQDTGRQTNNLQSIQSFVSFAILRVYGCGSNNIPPGRLGLTRDQLRQFWSGLTHQLLCLAELVRLLLQFASELLERQCLYTVAQVVEQS